MSDERDVLRGLLGPAAPEFTCERCFDEVDRFVELEVAGDDADLVMPGMRAHLEGCPACHEDYDSLREFVQSS